MAAAVVQDRQLVWSAGFGYADVGDQIKAGPNTPFGLASVTKPIAATLIMQLVEDGTIDLDEPIAAYGVDVAGSAGVTVRHLLTHTSEGEPDTTHNYSGNRYGWLGGVIEGATGRTFADVLSEQILMPLEMEDTITLTVVFGVFFSLTLFFDNRVLSTIPHPTSPYFGAMLSILAMAGLAVLLPLQSLMSHRGFGIPPAVPEGAEHAVATPTFRNAWWMLLLGVGIMIVTIGLSVTNFG